jgi:outer membrane immunogenic protein
LRAAIAHGLIALRVHWGLVMKLSHIALGASLSICVFGQSTPAARAAQIDDVLKRLEALELENTTLRDRVRRLEGRKVEQKTPAVANGPTVAAAAASPTAAYNAVTKAPPLAGPPVFNWTGFYVGAHFGGGFQNTTVEDPFAVAAGGGFAPPQRIDAAQIREGHGAGVLGGAQAGFNYQIGHLVVGAEANGSWSGVRATRNDTLSLTVSAAFPGFGVITDSETQSRRWRSETEWLATTSTRFGFAWDRWLVYTKAGIAAAHFTYSQTAQASESITGIGAPINASATRVGSGADTRLGFLGGVGGEWALGDYWSAFTEYNVMHFGSQPVALVGSTVGSSALFLGTFRIEQMLQTVKLGVNYRFPTPAL